MEEKTERGLFKPQFWIAAALIILVVAVVLPVFAWFTNAGIAAYAPISSHESLYIGAGHIEITDSDFDPDVKLEDVRYLYLDGIDLTDENKEYFDYVFCVYGKSLQAFNLQIAYTTNNQFTYEIYAANESSVTSAGAIAYTTHDDVSPQTYYYSIAEYSSDPEPVPVPVAGTALNATTVDGKTVANSTKHTATYGSYANVNRFAEPIYWQTDSSIATGLARADRGAFVKYYILRVHKGTKNINDRETDVICIAAKSGTLVEPEP